MEIQGWLLRLVYYSNGQNFYIGNSNTSTTAKSNLYLSGPNNNSAFSISVGNANTTLTHNNSGSFVFNSSTSQNIYFQFNGTKNLGMSSISATFYKNIFMNGTTTLNNNLSVSGTTTLTGATTINNSLTVSGTSTLNSTTARHGYLDMYNGISFMGTGNFTINQGYN